jgi:hypothetical protein
MPNVPGGKGDMQEMAPGVAKPTLNNVPADYVQRTAPQYTGLESAIGGAADMATFGFGDEIGAGVSSALTGEKYDEALARVRSNLDAARSEHPDWFIGGQVAGAIPREEWRGPLSGRSSQPPAPPLARSFRPFADRAQAARPSRWSPTP